MEENKLLATVITLSYNSEYLYETIYSVLQQKYGRIQYIIVDDASTSGFDKHEIYNYIEKNKCTNLESYHVIINEQNEGTIRALNRGLKLAQGDIIFNLAGDDCFADDMVLSDWISEFKSTGAEVITAYRDVYDKNLLFKTGTLPTRKQVKIIKNSTSFELFEVLASKNIIFGCCTARTKDSFSKYGEYDERYCLIEDYSFILHFLRMNGRVYFFDRVVVKYRLGGISSADNINNKYYEDSDAIFNNEIIPYVKNKKLVQKAYLLWKKEIARNQKFLNLKLKYKMNKVMLFYIKVAHNIHHPIKALKRFIYKYKQIKAFRRKYGN